MGILIGIGGVSRSGKSTLAKSILQAVPSANILCQDDFPSHESQIPTIRDRVDWEHPKSINWKNWFDAVEKSISDFQLTIADGLFAFYQKELEDHMTFKVYLSIDKPKFIELKAQDQRWGNEPDWFIEHIWDSHFEYGLPHSDNNLIEIHNCSQFHHDMVIEKIQEVLL